MATMAPPQPSEKSTKPTAEQKQKLQEIRALFAEGSEIGLRALDNLIARDEREGPTDKPPPAPLTNAGLDRFALARKRLDRAALDRGLADQVAKAQRI